MRDCAVNGRDCGEQPAGKGPGGFAAGVYQLCPKLRSRKGWKGTRGRCYVQINSVSWFRSLGKKSAGREIYRDLLLGARAQMEEADNDMIGNVGREIGGDGGLGGEAGCRRGRQFCLKSER